MAIISVYNKNTESFVDNGIVLPDTISCTIEEVLNGKYELELEHPIDSKGKWKYLAQEENIIKAGGQLFRIFDVEYDLDRISVTARHIFYDLLHNFLEDVRPTQLNGAAALDWVLNGTQYPHPFIGTSDITTLNTQYYIRTNPVEALLGADSMTTRWNGELERDNFNIRMWSSRGSNKGAHIAYGKNLQGLEIKRNMDSVTTRIMPVGSEALMLPEKYVESPLINNYAYPRIKKVNVNVVLADYATEADAYQAMRDLAGLMYTNNKLDIPVISIKADLVLLENTEEYKQFASLIDVELGDIVSCTDNPLDITFEAKVFRIVKDVIGNRNIQVELGVRKQRFTDTFDDTLLEISSAIQNNKSDLELAIQQATDLLTGALGGYVLKRAGELLIMDTEDPSTATKVWRWNLNGLGYSDNGINGPYELAMTINGVINADFITAGTISASLVKTGVLSSHDNSVYINLDNNSFNFNNSLYWDGTAGTLRLVSPDIPAPVDTSAFAPRVFGNGLMEISETNGFVAYKDATKTEFTQLYPSGLFRVSNNGAVKRPYFFERYVAFAGTFATKWWNQPDGAAEYYGNPTLAEIEASMGGLENTIQLPADFIGKDFKVIAEPSMRDGKIVRVMWDINGFATLGTTDNVYQITDSAGNLWDGITAATMPASIKSTGIIKVKSYGLYRGSTVNAAGYYATYVVRFETKIDVIA